MILEKDVKYDRPKLAEWFGITPESFSRTRIKRLEELKDYGEFEVFYTKTGNFSYLIFSKVHCDTYMKSYKKPFLKSLEEDDLWNKTGENGISNAAVVTNYYCSKHKIPYNGPHYIWIDDEGRSLDGKRKVVQSKKVPNPDFKIWHYLHRIAKAYYRENCENVDKIYYDMSADSWNPITLKLTTPEMLATRESIYKKYFGAASNNELIEVVDLIENTEEENISKEELKQLKGIARLSDKQKREAATKEIIEAAVLKKDGIKREKLDK